MVLLPCSTKGNDKHHCILGRMRKTCCFKTVSKLPITCVENEKACTSQHILLIISGQ
jgi:hypothetical protein